MIGKESKVGVDNLEYTRKKCVLFALGKENASAKEANTINDRFTPLEETAVVCGHHLIKPTMV